MAMKHRLRTAVAKIRRTWATAKRGTRRLPACVLALALVAGIGFAPPLARAQPNPFGCVGDCNQTGLVEIHELIICTNHAVGWPDSRGCSDVCDANGDGVIRIDEVVLAVGYALDGCPSHR